MNIDKCPICNTPPTHESTDTISLIQCQHCNVTWSLIKEEINQSSLYEDEVYEVVDNRGSVFEKIIFYEADKVLSTANRLLDKPIKPRILDFGCGKGQFLFRAKKSGWDTNGVETAPARAAFAREKYGIEVTTQEYESGVIGEGNYQLIVLLHVLEHLPKPLPLLSEILKANLAINGVLVIEVPNYNSWQSKLAGKKWMHLDLPRHLTHWNEKSLKQELENVGLKAVYQESFSFHLGVLGMLSSIMSRFGYKQNIILQLKQHRSMKLMFLVALCMPFAMIAEVIASIFDQGGVLRIYFRRK